MAKDRLFIAELSVWKENIEKPVVTELYAEIGQDKEAFENHAYQVLAEKYDTDTITPAMDLPDKVSPVREFESPELIEGFRNGSMTKEEIWRHPATFEVVVPIAAVMRTSKFDGKLFTLGDKSEKMNGFSFWANKDKSNPYTTCVWEPHSLRNITLRFDESRPVRMEKFDPVSRRKIYKDVDSCYMRQINSYLQKRVATMNKSASVNKEDVRGNAERSA